jgi:uncharacterized protein YjiS (DUF1127 family)
MMARRSTDHVDEGEAAALAGRLARWFRARHRERGSLRDLDPHILRDLGLDRPQVALGRVRR